MQSYFDAIEIVIEKDNAMFKRLIEQFKIVKSHGWMVGNSPAHGHQSGAASGIERGVHSACGHLGGRTKRKSRAGREGW